MSRSPKQGLPKESDNFIIAPQNIKVLQGALTMFYYLVKLDRSSYSNNLHAALFSVYPTGSTRDP